MHSSDDAEVDCPDPDQERDGSSRRDMIKSMFTTTACVFGSILPRSASAFESSFPVELSSSDGDLSRDILKARKAKMEETRAKKNSYMTYITDKSPFFFRDPKDFLTCTIWGVALYLLAGGTQSNPMVTRVANFLYDPKDEPWLQDRNNGFRAPVPGRVLAVMAILFLILGNAIDRLMILLTDGGSNYTLQLAVVTLISASVLELGRSSVGERPPTRREFERGIQLTEEFAEFADQRLQRGGAVHKGEVTRAFRRYFSKYRTFNDEYPLTDREIEKLFQSWCRFQGVPEWDRSGVCIDISINKNADAFG